MKIPSKLIFSFLLLLFLIWVIRDKTLQRNQDLQTQITEVGDNLDFELEKTNQQIASKAILTSKQLKQTANTVTVKIFTDDEDENRGGSGVIISEDKNNYFVITNDHVISNIESNYKLQTHEGNIYSVEIIKRNNRDLIVDDLALLKFTTSNEYPVVKIKQDLSLSHDKIIFACGFPFLKNLEQSSQIQYTLGNIKNVLSRPLIGGYQIGYTNTIHNGMSGGSILNLYGELIGINGLGKEPLLGNPYVYQNGENVPESEFEQMSQLSWGITSKSIVNFVNLTKTEAQINFTLDIVEK